MKHFDSSIKAGYMFLDESLKSKGGSGFGDVPISGLTELTSMELRKRLPSHIVENHPIYALGLILTGVLGKNALEIKKANQNIE